MIQVPADRAGGRPSGSAASTVWLTRVRPWQPGDAVRGEQRRGNWPQAWRKHTGIYESSVYLTYEEFAGIAGAFNDLLLRYISDRLIDDVATRQEGSVPVTFTLFSLPGSTPPGSGSPGSQGPGRVP